MIFAARFGHAVDLCASSRTIRVRPKTRLIYINSTRLSTQEKPRLFVGDLEEGELSDGKEDEDDYDDDDDDEEKCNRPFDSDEDIGDEGGEEWTNVARSLATIFQN